MSFGGEAGLGAVAGGGLRRVYCDILGASGWPCLSASLRSVEGPSVEFPEWRPGDRVERRREYLILASAGSVAGVGPAGGERPPVVREVAPTAWPAVFTGPLPAERRYAEPVTAPDPGPLAVSGLRVHRFGESRPAGELCRSAAEVAVKWQAVPPANGRQPRWPAIDPGGTAGLALFLRGGGDRSAGRTRRGTRVAITKLRFASVFHCRDQESRGGELVVRRGRRVRGGNAASPAAETPAC